MKSELAKQLKELLDNMNQEQFDQEWNSIAENCMEGPTFIEALEYYALSDVSDASFVFSQEPIFNQEIIPGNDNYNIAA